MSEHLEEIRKDISFIKGRMTYMLRELTNNSKVMKVLVAGGTIEEIGAYSYGRTKTSDEFILLFSSVKKLEHKICRVYKEQFYQLPWFINYKDIPISAPEGNDQRSSLQRQGLLKTCTPFTIATKPGRQTQMGQEKRFYLIIDAPPEPKKKQPEPPPKDAKIIAEEAEVTTPDTDTALQNINNMFGLGQTEPTHEANDFFDNFLYKDQSAVADNEEAKAIYTHYFGTNHDVPDTAPTLAKWYRANQEMVDAKITANGGK